MERKTMRALTSTEADWSIRRRELLNVAAGLFAEGGLDAVSMRDIAKAGGLHMSTLYYYFPNKAEIYAAACHWAFEQVSRETMMALECDGSPEDKIKTFTHTVVRFLFENTSAARLLDQHFVFGTNHLEQFDYPPITRDPTERIGELLRAMGSSLLADFKPGRAGEIIWDVVYGIARYGAAHSVVNSQPTNQRAWKDLADEAWLVAKRLIGTPSH